ncbi:hypothetical protein AVEN_269189-1 [Araneus ventricosus]|uniref:Transposase Tc1-like domain-containing protein n=1 Tax=Araneus ventricosus TaxID=182803 RepID=A0A4Y2I380_ARAVE|nr:hypothetical protein AVEN_269189-1 [Araneus ventricosus]
MRERLKLDGTIAALSLETFLDKELGFCLKKKAVAKENVELGLNVNIVLLKYSRTSSELLTTGKSSGESRVWVWGVGVDRPRVIKEKGRRRLSRLVKQNRRQTVAQLTAQYNTGPSASVSEHAVQRTLLDMGLCNRRTTRVPLLTKRHRQLCLQGAREHRDWTIDEWKRVAWSDESQFLIHHVDVRVRVRRLPGEQLLPFCTAGHTQAGGGGIMLWGTFSWAALGPVVSGGLGLKITVASSQWGPTHIKNDLFHYIYL